MGFKVLIVDDNGNNRFTLKSIIDSMDIDVVEAETGSEALECLLRHDIHLIILDIQLPDLDGFEIAKLIKSRKSTMSIPIIFATAVFKSDEFIMKGYELGAVDYVLKPFKVNVIVSKIRYYESIEKERQQFIKALEEKNEKLEISVKALSHVQNELMEAVDNWRLLGENIPYDIEVYDSNNTLLFRNKDYDEGVEHHLHMLKSKELIDQLNDTKKHRETIKKNYQIDVHGKLAYYEVKTVYINTKLNPKAMMIISDITLQKNYLDGITYIGYHDQLTGLWNRHYFTDFIKKMPREEVMPLTLIMADVNGLKLINDGLGHTSGDELIKAAADCLQSNTSSDTIIARWGGDEFLMLLPNTNARSGQQIARKVSKSIENERIAGKFPVSMALGSVTCEVEDFDFEDLIKQAEDKMYMSKMQNQSSYRSFIVESLKNALFEQDYETKEHTERISRLSMIIADHLNLSQNEKDKLALLGSLHDIGKIGIPISILNNTGKLSEIDWNIIRKHPAIGYRICVNVPELSSVADLILSHHEKWDGTGYPRGLSGADIPLLSRLISILDTFDVITHDRPYKKGQSTEWALEEIKRCSGTQFDPNLVNVFVHVYTELSKEEQNVE